ncbi:extracellular solute-binding protein [Candidatus Omnitrophota bacterium]
MRISRLILALMVAAAMMSGCGGPDEATKGEHELVMWLVGSEAQSQTVEELARDFYARTGIKARCETVSWGNAHSKYLTSVAGGVAPDIGTMGLTWGMEFGVLGVMIDLAQEFPEDIRIIRKKVFSGMWDSIEYKGRVYGIPFDMTEHVLYYRNDIIQDPPSTWEELTALLPELNKQGKGMIFDWGSMSWIGFSCYLWQAGGDYYDKGFTKATLDSPEAVSALTFFSELYTKYKVPKTRIPVEQGMRTGDFPLAISGNWKIQGLTLGAPEINGKWSIAPLPRGPSGKRTAFLGGRVMGIFGQSKKKKEAWEFIKFLFEPESQKKLYNDAVAKQDAYLPPNLNSWGMLDIEKSLKSVLINQARDAKGPPPVVDWDTSTKYIDEAIQKVILQGASPEKELGAANDELNKLLKD